MTDRALLIETELTCCASACLPYLHRFISMCRFSSESSTLPSDTCASIPPRRTDTDRVRIPRQHKYSSARVHAAGEREYWQMARRTIETALPLSASAP